MLIAAKAALPQHPCLGRSSLVGGVIDQQILRLEIHEHEHGRVQPGEENRNGPPPVGDAIAHERRYELWSPGGPRRYRRYRLLDIAAGAPAARALSETRPPAYQS